MSWAEKVNELRRLCRAVRQRKREPDRDLMDKENRRDMRSRRVSDNKVRGSDLFQNKLFPRTCSPFTFLARFFPSTPANVAAVFSDAKHMHIPLAEREALLVLSGCTMPQ